MIRFDIRNSDILVVDDTPQNLKLLSSMLTERGYRVRPAINGEIALQSARKSLPDLILLDIQMPGLNGYEVCQELKADVRTREIPVVFLSALDSTDDKVKAFQAGGVDYITKPFQIEEVMARVEAQLTLHQQWRAIEDFLRRERAYYEQLNQLKDDLVRTTSHDLKNPISVIMGYADLLRQDLEGSLNATTENYLDRIQGSAGRMLRLVTDLLDLAQAEAGIAIQPEEVEINAFLENILPDLDILARQKHQTLTFTPAPQTVLTLIDSHRMEQVMTNLIANAIKYTAENGQIEVVVKAAHSDQVTIQVKDNGLGIPEKDIPSLFDRFFRVDTEAHRAIEGTGLGLAIVKAIVTQHNGIITVDSILGHGSTFNVILPLA